MSLPTTSRLGFLKAEIALLSSASIMAFLFVLESCGIVVPKLRESACGFWGRLGSPPGSPLDETGSLPSRMTLETEVEVADRKSAIALLGPLETLLDCCSVDSARCSVFRAFANAGRLAAAPGFCSLLPDGRWDDFAFRGDSMTGPPSLRLMELQSFGRRAE